MGSARQRRDDRGREKVQCRDCTLWYHRLDLHVASKHDGIEKYLARHPGAPLMSESARKKESLKGGEAEATAPDDQSFKFGVARLRERECDDDERRLVPVHDEDWTLGDVEREALDALALAIEDDENVLIAGPAGVGKSTLVKELGAILNVPLRRMPFRGDMRVSDIIGSKSLAIDPDSGQSVTTYEQGWLPDAAQRGHWVLVDEIDAGPAEVMFTLFPVLENPRSLTLSADRGGREIVFDPRFRFIATANTLGWGDESGLYAGTSAMNEALLDRFHTVITLGYPDEASEVKRLVQASGIAPELAQKMVTAAKAIREAQKRDQTAVSFSPRRLIMWAKKAVRMGDPIRAARYTVTNRLPDEDATFVANMIQRFFGGSVR
jgi:cobaltochelatase CobS